jgi:hypothetical protein
MRNDEPHLIEPLLCFVQRARPVARSGAVATWTYRRLSRTSTATDLPQQLSDADSQSVPLGRFPCQP